MHFEEERMMNRLSALAACTVLAGFASSTLGEAQVTNTGTLQVIAVDKDDARLPGVTVSASASDVVTTRAAVTDGEGVATLSGLAPSTQYEVVAQLPGFAEYTQEKILVRSGQITQLRVGLTLAGVTEAVTVMSESPVIDVTRATTGADITLQLTEALPTGRSYQSYLQMVPGVLPDDPIRPGNPAARGGLNYSDILGELGVSSDNFYYFDGINVTDPVTGTFGANLNTEIIQEQKVITGGIPAEFVGTPGLISNVVTKSGSNTPHGSVNYFFQNSSLVGENENAGAEEFSTKDSAVTLGAPILRDRLWAFGSYRYTNRQDDVISLDTDEFLRQVDNTQHQGFAKGTWAPTGGDLISATFLNDPTEITGRRDRDITNARDRAREQGGNRYSANYSKVFGSALLVLGYNRHNGEVSDFSAIREPENTIIFRDIDERTTFDEQLGGFGRDLVDQRDTAAYRGTLEYTWRSHRFKGGLEFSRNENFRDTLYVGPRYESIAARYLGTGVSAANIAGALGNTWSVLAFDYSNPSDFGGFIRTIDARPDRARFYSAFDLNGDGTISEGELGSALVFNSNAGNPNGAVNYDRTAQSATGPQDTSSDGLSFFIQDEWQVNRFTFNAGMRAERWKHFATTGESIFTFPWEFAPRLSAVVDVLGDGRQRASVYYGRYYDPIRNNMTNFAGTLTGSVFEEQIYALGEWVTYRTRGGATVQDAFFSPTTQTPYTDDVQAGYAIDLGRNMSFEGTYINRRTRDILEDYDLELYATAQDGMIHYPGPIDTPDSLFLGLDYFGYNENPGSNFVIATLAGGERNYQGVELVFRKRFDRRWQLLTSYNWNDAEGNTNSDSNADFQGDVIWLDPRAPNQYGRQPGLIRHLMKGAASYAFDMGLQLGATANWNSGTVASRTFRASSRNLPARVDEPFEFAGVTSRWLAPNAVGSLENPSWGTVDMRAQYIHTLIGRTQAEIFVDVFNIFNNQTAIRDQDLLAGEGLNEFGDPIAWLTPRRAFIGARVRF
jgi:hypothetical protein